VKSYVTDLSHAVTRWINPEGHECETRSLPRGPTGTPATPAYDFGFHVSVFSNPSCAQQVTVLEEKAAHASVSLHHVSVSLPRQHRKKIGNRARQKSTPKIDLTSRMNEGKEWMTTDDEKKENRRCCCRTIGDWSSWGSAAEMGGSGIKKPRVVIPCSE
jgi:hypothetical protein